MRWGELVGGLLIVCCSIALVISFWSAIAERPWLKFIVFNGVTAGLFGVGFYSEKRWRLKTTSQGLLLIGAMLVPLNFLAIAAFSSAPDSGQVLVIAGEIVSAVLFATLVYLAGTILFDSEAPWLTAGVLVPSLAQLLVRRFVDPECGLATLASIVAVPVAAYLVVNARAIARARAIEGLGEADVNGLFEFVGLTSFAVVLCLALVAFKSAAPLATLRRLPLVPSAVALVPLTAGLLLWQKLAGRGMTALRMAGTSVAVFGAMLSLVGLVAGWPEPQAMLPAALVELAIFTWIAWRFALPSAHLVAAACGALAYLLVVNLATGELSWSGEDWRSMTHALLSGSSGTLLVPLVLVYAAAASVARSRWRETAVMLAVATAALATISAGLVSWFGWGVEGDPLGARWVYAIYAAGLLALAARSDRPLVAWCGAVLLLAAVAQTVIFAHGSEWCLPARRLPRCWHTRRWPPRVAWRRSSAAGCATPAGCRALPGKRP